MENTIEKTIISKIKNKPKYNNLAILVALAFMFVCIFSSSFMFLLKHFYLPAFFLLFIGNIFFFIIGFIMKGMKSGQIVFNTTIPVVFFVASLIGFILAYNALIHQPDISHILRHVRVVFAMTTLSFSYLCGRFIGLQNEINSNVYVEESSIDEIVKED